MCQASLEQLMVNVIVVAVEQWLCADDPSGHCQHNIKNWQAKSNNWNGHSHNRGRLLRTRQSQRAQHESEEQASGITQKDGGWMEIESKETQDSTCQGDRKKGYKLVWHNERHHKNNCSGKKC